jgi:hypothetical protein
MRKPLRIFVRTFDGRASSIAFAHLRKLPSENDLWTTCRRLLAELFATSARTRE